MSREEGSIIVIADTHLGLRPPSWNPFGFRNTLSCQPEILSGFLKWLRKLEEEGSSTIRLEDNGDKILLPPSELVLLGDIIELWDASNRSIEFSSRDFYNAISDLKCEKIYLLGNHDDILEGITGLLPSGKSTMKIIKGIYPEQPVYPEQREKISYKKRGDKNYIFLHGHQFDRMFISAGSFWKLLAYLRDGAEAFGSFSWIIVGFFIVYTILSMILKLQVNWIFLLLVGFLAVPRILVSLARPIWNKLFGSRYNRERAVKGFYNFWVNFTEKVDASSDVNVVYGHTHIVDKIDHKDIEDIVGRADWKVRATLLNIPSWVIDEKENWYWMMLAIFLYIDDEGAYFIGWDWDLERPFHISNKMIKSARVEYPIPLKSI